MAFIIHELVWDDWNIEHIARHHVSPEEVEEVCFSKHWPLRAKGQDKRALLGQTNGGRYLLVILGKRGEGLYYPVTARDMTEAEHRRYQEWKRR